MFTICLVEDEIDLSNVVKVYLEKAGYQVITFTKGEDAINYIGNKVDLWILDIMLGDDINGYDIIGAIRKKDENIPVIFTSARDLELGSDDYITKPYSSKELVLRVNNIIKRVYKNEENKKIEYDIYKIDIEKRIAYKEDKPLNLTTLEFDLLLLFLNNRGKGFQREEILNSVWGDNYFGTDRVVDDLVRRLRKKMPKLKIKAIYGFGYRMS